MKQEIHPAIEEIHEVRRKIFKKYGDDPHLFGGYLAERMKKYRKISTAAVRKTRKVA